MLNTRTKEFIESEVATITEYCERVFNVQIDLVSFKNLINETITEKVEDYIYQRIRDWPVKDLLSLERALSLIINEENERSMQAIAEVEAQQTHPTSNSRDRKKNHSKAH